MLSEIHMEESLGITKLSTPISCIGLVYNDTMTQVSSPCTDP